MSLGGQMFSFARMYFSLGKKRFLCWNFVLSYCSWWGTSSDKRWAWSWCLWGARCSALPGCSSHWARNDFTAEISFLSCCYWLGTSSDKKWAWSWCLLEARCSALPGCCSPWATNDFYNYIFCSIFKAFLLCNLLQSGWLIPIMMKALFIPSNFPTPARVTSYWQGAGRLHSHIYMKLV